MTFTLPLEKIFPTRSLFNANDLLVIAWSTTICSMKSFSRNNLYQNTPLILTLVNTYSCRLSKATETPINGSLTLRISMYISIEFLSFSLLKVITSVVEPTTLTVLLVKCHPCASCPVGRK